MLPRRRHDEFLKTCRCRNDFLKIWRCRAAMDVSER
jgi:hypothetical protein